MVEWLGLPLPLVPVTVTVYVPFTAPAVVKVSLDVPVPPVTVVGVKFLLTPLGSADVVRPTVPVNPLLGVMVTVVDTLPPFRGSCRLVGETLMEKSGAPGGVAVAVGVFVGVGVLVGVLVGVGVLVDVPGVGVLVAVDVGVLVGVGVGVLVGPVEPPQDGNLNEAMRVLQLKVPLVFSYSEVNQKVQSSTGSTVMAL